MPETERLSATRTIDSAPADIFQIVSDPGGHVRIDGSGMLIEPQSAERPTAVGDTFVMLMDGPARGFPAVPTYLVVNTVTRYEPNAVYEWTVGLPDQDPIGHVYGFTLEPTDGNSTEVTHYYDWSGASPDWKANMHYPVIPQEGLVKTLDNLAEASQ